jgi:O-antigen ligase
LPLREAVSQLAVKIIMGGGSLIALGLLVSAIRRARAAGDLDGATALTLAMGWGPNVAVALVAITGGLTRRLDAFRQLTAFYPGWYVPADRLGMALTAALALFLLVRRATTVHVPVHAAGLFAIALWATAHLAGGLQGGHLITPRGAALLACLAAATVLPRGRGACLGVGIFSVTLAIASGALAVFRHGAAFVIPCEGSCGGLGFTGLLPNPNLLGIVLAASIPFAYLGFRGRARAWFAVYLAGMTIATGSQTATGAAAIVLVVLLLVRPRLDADRVTAGPAAVAGVMLAGAVSASAVFPLHHWAPSALSERGLLWQVARTYIRESPWIGYGPDRWAGLYDSSQIFQAAQRSAHNQWMDVLFTAGGIGAFLLVCLVAATLLSSGRAFPGAAITAATLVMIGATEGMWSVGTFDLMSFSLVALILTGASGSGATHGRRTGHATVAASPRRGQAVHGALRPRAPLHRSLDPVRRLD